MSISHPDPLVKPPGAIPDRDASGPRNPPPPCIVVVLVRPGILAQEFCLEEGSTVKDLLNQVEASGEWDVVVEQRRLDESEPLRSGSFVYLLESGRSAPVPQRWKEWVGAFKDDPYFREIVEAGRDIREAERDRS